MEMDIQRIEHILKNWFSFPEKKIYCQVSTVSSDRPCIRTMELQDVTENGNLILLTEISTKKWEQLQKNNKIAVCIVHPDSGQIIVEGEAELKTYSIDPVTTSFYWNNFVDQYWRDFYLSRSSNHEKNIPPSFGAILVKPFFWEILEIDMQDYLKSSRKQYQLIGKEWNVVEALVT